MELAKYNYPDAKRLKLYEHDIDMAARLLANGWTPLSMTEQGHTEEAVQFRRIIGTLEDNQLMGVVTQRKNELLRQRSHETPQSQKPPTIQSQESGRLPIQDNFFSLMQNAQSPLALSVRYGPDPEEGINRMHNEWRRKKIQAADAGHEWREFLKNVGAATWPEKRIRLSKKVTMRIAFLKACGIWEDLISKMPYQEISDKLQSVLDDPPEYYDDPTEPDGRKKFDIKKATSLHQTLSEMIY